MNWNKIVINKNTFDKLKDTFNEVVITIFENKYYTNNGFEIIINDLIPDNSFVGPEINKNNAK